MSGDPGPDSRARDSMQVELNRIPSSHLVGYRRIAHWAAGARGARLGASSGQAGNCTPAKWDPPGEGSHGFARVLLWGYLAATANPACSARAAALSVASQVNSGSVRPKWPYAAVFW